MKTTQPLRGKTYILATELNFIYQIDCPEGLSLFLFALSAKRNKKKHSALSAPRTNGVRGRLNKKRYNY
jgi:hypothetical protein